MTSRKKRGESSFIPTRKNARPPSFDEYLNSYFERTDAANKAEEDFFRQYLGYLSDEREKRIEEISDSLRASATESVNATLFRNIDLKYIQNPLCTFGSIQSSGQRFNIGSSLQRYRVFHCLYLSNEEDTCYTERFHYPRSFKKGLLDAEEMALRKSSKKNYANVEVEVALTNCLDLRKPDALRGVSEVLSQIKAPENLKELAKKYGILSLRTVQTHGELLSNLLDPEFRKHNVALEQPSNSQWFGYYCLRAGIQTIIYPSVRHSSGTNFAVLIDNIKDTDSKLRLTADVEVIEKSYREMHSENFEFFKIAQMAKRRETESHN